jgi:hypothetical protein
VLDQQSDRTVLDSPAGELMAIVALADEAAEKIPAAAARRIEPAMVVHSAPHANAL